MLNSADDYIAIAADKGVSQKGASYDRCKIVALDNQLVYAATGYTSRADGPQIGGMWDESALAKQMYRSLAKNPRHELIPKLAEALGASLASRLNQSVEAHPQEGRPPILVTPLFAGFDENGKRMIIQVNVMRTDERHVSYTARLCLMMFTLSSAARLRSRKSTRWAGRRNRSRGKGRWLLKTRVLT